VITPLRTGLAALALAVAVVPATAGPADAATKKNKRTATKTVAKKRTAKKPTKTVKSTPAATVETAAPAPVETPAPAPAPTFTSVISIGGFVFYNISYAEAVEQYQALIASGATPPAPVTSISVTIGVGN
jgi:hypothetical protein